MRLHAWETAHNQTWEIWEHLGTIVYRKVGNTMKITQLFDRTTDHHRRPQHERNYYAHGVIMNELARQYDAACDRRDWMDCDRLHSTMSTFLRHGAM